MRGGNWKSITLYDFMIFYDNIMSKALRFAFLILLIGAFLLSGFLPKEAMFAKNEQTGQIQIQICSARGANYLSLSEFLDKTNATQTQTLRTQTLRTQILLSKNGAPVRDHDKRGPHSDCPSIIPASTAIASGYFVPFAPVRMAKSVLHSPPQPAAFVGQMPIRLSARGPPLCI